MCLRLQALPKPLTCHKASQELPAHPQLYCKLRFQFQGPRTFRKGWLASTSYTPPDQHVPTPNRRTQPKDSILSSAFVRMPRWGSMCLAHNMDINHCSGPLGLRVSEQNSRQSWADEPPHHPHRNWTIPTHIQEKPTDNLEKCMVQTLPLTRAGM